MPLLWFLLALPLITATVLHLGLKKSATFSSLLSTLSAVATFAIALILKDKTGEASFSWATIGDLNVEIGLIYDKLAAGMMLVVTGVGALVHIFSLGYMKDDAAKARYFTCLSLFMFSMTGIVLSSNFLMMFMFWELVGLSSFLLIGHWYHKPSAGDAAKKAFLTNRIGDFGFMIGILMIWGITGTFAFGEMAITPGSITTGVLGAAILCVFAGAIGKSAQLPLHVWLPDAMEGPTPVSALIHAATMVAAGVYMMARFFFAITPEGFELVDVIPAFSATTIASIGGITSLVAALMATQQDDIKKILAYSTLSQLGYMVMAVGLLAPEAGMFHLYTHAWFKALLFLGSACVIFACHHEQNIWKMGGLLKKMPITAVTFLIGYAALIGVPLLSGSTSKKEIFLAAYTNNPALFWVAVAVAFLTTFYMTRLIVVAFLGQPRTDGADHAKEVGPIMFVPLLALASLAVVAAFSFATDFLNAQVPGTSEIPQLIYIASYATLGLGLVAAFFLYNGKEKDPVSIPLFKNRFYIDDIYDKGLVKWFQDFFAAIVHFLDEFIIGGLIVGGLTRSAAGIGNIFRSLQNGSIQAYSLLLGFGTILVIYLTVFVK